MMFFGQHVRVAQRRINTIICTPSRTCMFSCIQEFFGVECRFADNVVRGVYDIMMFFGQHVSRSAELIHYIQYLPISWHLAATNCTILHNVVCIEVEFDWMGEFVTLYKFDANPKSRYFSLLLLDI